MSNKEETAVALPMLSKLQSRAEYQILIDSGTLPSSFDTPEKLMAVVKTGSELGMPAMVSINNINVIQGRTVISASMMGALLKESGVEYIFTRDYDKEKETGKITTEMEFEWISKITGNPKTSKFAVTWGQFKLAGYTEKPNWKKYPKEMMRSRCMTSAIRYLFPEVLLRSAGGLYSDVEIVDSMNGENDIKVGADGQVEVIYAEATDVTNDASETDAQ